MSDYTSNSKHRTEKTKAKTQKEKPKKPKQGRLKPIFTEIIGRKCRLI